MGWVIFIVLLIGILLLSPVSAEVKFRHVGAKNDMHLVMRYLYFFRYTFHGPAVKIDPVPSTDPPSHDAFATATSSFETYLDKASAAIERAKALWPALRKRARVFKVHQLYWMTTIGVGDAPETAMACGMAWAVQGIILGLLSDLFWMYEEPLLDVVPVYHEQVFATEVSCILRGSLGKAIYAGLRLFRLFKMGDEYARTSDPIVDADCDGELEGNGGREHDHRRSRRDV